MTQHVFLSYSRHDEARAQEIAAQLERDGVPVWIDKTLQSGEFFPSKIDSAVRSAKAVLCLWSSAACASEWVRAEALVGFERRSLVPVTLEQCVIPVPFNAIHANNLTTWAAKDGDHPEWRALLARMSEKLGRQALRLWASRARPATVEDYVSLALNYPSDPLAKLARVRAKEELGVNVDERGAQQRENVVSLEPLKPVAPVSETALGTSYDAKRQEIAAWRASELNEDVPKLRGAIQAAQSLKLLHDDLRRLFPNWVVDVQLLDWRDVYEDLLSLRVGASDEELRSALDDFVFASGDDTWPEFDEVKHYIQDAHIVLACDNFAAEVRLDKSGLIQCELDDRTDQVVSAFDPHSFAEHMAEQSVRERYADLSQLNMWLRERFVEWCALIQRSPADVERGGAVTVSEVRAAKSTQCPGIGAVILSSAALAMILYVGWSLLVGEPLGLRGGNGLLGIAGISALAASAFYTYVLLQDEGFAKASRQQFLYAFWLSTPLKLIALLAGTVVAVTVLIWIVNAIKGGS